MKYETVVYLQGDDYGPFEAALYPESTPEDLSKGRLLGAPSVNVAFKHLMQWEDGEPRETLDSKPWGASDEVRVMHDGRQGSQQYVMSWHTGLSYAALTRVVES